MHKKTNDPWIPGVRLIDARLHNVELAMKSVRIVDAAIAKMMKGA